jgi:hypothetical protein
MAGKMSKRRAVLRRKFMIASAAAIIYFHVGAFCVGHAECHDGEMASSLSLYTPMVLMMMPRHGY